MNTGQMGSTFISLSVLFPLLLVLFLSYCGASEIPLHLVLILYLINSSSSDPSISLFTLEFSEVFPAARF